MVKPAVQPPMRETFSKEYLPSDEGRVVSPRKLPFSPYVYVTDQQTVVGAHFIDAGAHLNLLQTHSEREGKIVSFFAEAFNHLRRLQGSTEVPILVDTPDRRVTTEQLQEYATETPLLAAGTVPTAAPEILKESGIISGDLVSEDMFLLLEGPVD